MLTTTQVALVQNSFAVIAPIADDAAVLFYQRLEKGLGRAFAVELRKA